MVVELVRNRSKESKVNDDLISMLREVLRMAEAGELQAAAVAYVQAGAPAVCYDADGHEAAIACAARQIEEEMRCVLFDDDSV